MTWDFQTWYKENKKALSERRKKKYRRDAAYRKACKKRALDYYHSHKKKMEPVDRFKVKSSGNRVYFTIGRVARAINRKVGRVRELHQSGIIPEPLYFDKRGWRLYTGHQLKLLETAFYKVDTKKWLMNDVEVYLRKHWEVENGKERKGKTDG